MGVVKTPDIKSGMILAEDLTSPQGRLLYREGSTLTQDNLRILKMWGVREANIYGIPQQKVNTLNLLDVDPELFSMSDEYVGRYMPNLNPEHETMSEIYRLCFKRTVRHIAEGNELPENVFPFNGGTPSTFLNSASATVDPRSITQHIHETIPFPEIYSRINELLNSPYRSTTNVAKTIAENDPLATSLLELVNSPLYAFPSRIDSIYQAVSILGAEELNTIVLGISVYTFFKNFLIPAEFANHFWKHAIFCGCVAKLLAGLLPGVTIERFFVAGLLHDIGKIAIAIAAPKQMGNIQNYTLQYNVPDYQAEQHILGFDHTLLGKMLLDDWMLPKTIVAVARFHHDPMQSAMTLEPAIVHLADILTLAYDTATIKPTIFPPLKKSAWDSLGFPLATLEPVVIQAEKQATAISKLIIKETCTP